MRRFTYLARQRYHFPPPTSEILASSHCHRRYDTRTLRHSTTNHHSFSDYRDGLSFCAMIPVSQPTARRPSKQTDTGPATRLKRRWQWQMVRGSSYPRVRCRLRRLESCRDIDRVLVCSEDYSHCLEYLPRPKSSENQSFTYLPSSLLTTVYLDLLC